MGTTDTPAHRDGWLAPAPRRRAGFTLIELLVVVAIVAVLAGMLMPALGTVRSAARSLHCASTLRQIGLGTVAYSTEWHGKLGPSHLSTGLWKADWQIPGGRSFFWTDEVRIGGQLDGAEVANADFGTTPRRSPWHCPEDRRLAQHAIKTSVSFGMNHILMRYGINVVGETAAWAADRAIATIPRPSDMALATDTQDGRWLTNPTWVAENNPLVLPVITQQDPAGTIAFAGLGVPAPYHIIGRHRRGSNVLFVDGHVAWTATLDDDVAQRRVLVNPVHAQ